MTSVVRAIGRGLLRLVIVALIPVSVGILIAGYVIESQPRPVAIAPSDGATPGERTAEARATPTHEPGPTPHPAMRTGAAWISADGALIAVGGTGPGGRLLASVARFDGAVWTDLPSLPEHRVGAAGVALSDGTVIVAGGEHESEPRDTTFILRPEATAWTEGQPMPSAQARMTAAAVREQVFVFGGASPGHERDLLIYDVAADAWTFGTPLPTPLSHSTAIALDGLVYLFGGQGEDGAPTTAAHRYDPTTDAWDTLAPISAPMESVPAVVVNGRIWLTSPVVDPGTGASRMAVYDPSTERWQLAVIGSTARLVGGQAAALRLADERILMLTSGGTGLSIDMIPTAGVELVDP